MAFNRPAKAKSRFIADIARVKPYEEEKLSAGSEKVRASKDLLNAGGGTATAPGFLDGQKGPWGLPSTAAPRGGPFSGAAVNPMTLGAATDLGVKRKRTGT